MAKEYKQCKGITSRGIQCKINAPEGYCHYHIAQRGKKIRINSSPTKVRSINGNGREIQGNTISRGTSPTKQTEKNGFIYVYTLTRLLVNNDKDWSLKVRNLPNVSNKHRDTWVPFKSEKSPYMLIKVGMTTQTVQRRLRQWQDKCHHDLTCLHPQKNIQTSSKIDLIIYRFKGLSIKKQPVKFRTYNEEQFGFQCPRGVNLAESEIHKMLIAKYGSGDVYCTGCKGISSIEDSSKWKLFNHKLHSKDPFQDGYNIHVEWFLIPKKDLERVYRLIDTVCSKYYH
mmetsp:Transcript_590/g.657  ORF Transcript_590/g.657 Transcript_590/m.657 type:complete len:284 (+) Transcript_590:218-1069(+)